MSEINCIDGTVFNCEECPHTPQEWEEEAKKNNLLMTKKAYIEKINKGEKNNA